MKYKIIRQQGIALIQVLLITAVLSVLALYLTSTAKDQVTMARWADDKATALVALHSAEAELLFNLLTELKKTDATNIRNNDNDVVNKWNFYDNPFAINQQVTVAIQDQAGLIHAHYPDISRLKALIASQGFGVNETNVLADSLLDWQDLDSIPRINGAESVYYQKSIRDGAVPDIHDVSFIKNMTPQLLATFLSNMTISRDGFFNPMTSPTQLLAALTNEQTAAQVNALRDSKQLTDVQFSQLTGIVEDDHTLFYPSNFLSIKFQSKVGESLVQKNMILEISPYANDRKRPFTFYANRG